MPRGETDRQAAHPGHIQKHPTVQQRDRDSEAPTKTRAWGETDGSKFQEDTILTAPIGMDVGERWRQQSVGLGGGGGGAAVEQVG